MSLNGVGRLEDASEAIVESVSVVADMGGFNSTKVWLHGP